MRITKVKVKGMTVLQDVSILRETTKGILLVGSEKKEGESKISSFIKDDKKSSSLLSVVNKAVMKDVPKEIKDEYIKRIKDDTTIKTKKKKDQAIKKAEKMLKM